MPLNPAQLADAERLEFAIQEGRQRTLDAWSKATSAGTAIMRAAAEGAWAPLAAEAKERIIAEMGRRYPAPGSPSLHDQVLAANPRFKDVLAATLRLSKSQYARIGPHVKEGARTVLLDSPAVSTVDDRRRVGPVTDFDARNGLVCSMAIPDGMTIADRPVCLSLVGASFDPEILERVRWRVGKPVKILADGEDEPS